MLTWSTAAAAVQETGNRASEWANVVTQRASDFFEWATSNGADWAIWAAVAAALFVGLRFLRSVVSGLFRSSKASPNAVRNIIGGLVGATSSLFLLALAAFVTAPFTIELPDTYQGILGGVFTVASFLQIAFWARVVARAVVDGVVVANAPDDSSLENARSLISLFANVAIFAIAAILILSNLGQDVGALIAGLGVGGIAIGLAAQSLFRDLFASLSIVLDKPFTREDFITWNDNAGTVKKIGLKTTRMQALSGEQIVVSNDELLSNEIHNWRRMSERRVVLTLGVTYDTPRSKLEQLPGEMKRLIETRDMCRFDRAHLSGYGDFAILFEVVFFVLSREYNVFMDEQQEVLLDIHAVFERLDIDFAFPTQTLHLQSVPKSLSSRGS